MVERFNGRISDIVNQTSLGSAVELESTLRNYVKIYNHNIPQRALKHQTPVQALKAWHGRENSRVYSLNEYITKRVLKTIYLNGVRYDYYKEETA